MPHGDVCRHAEQLGRQVRHAGNWQARRAHAMGKKSRPDSINSGSPVGFASHVATDWVLVTGQPGCGKTTAVKRLAAELAKVGVRLRGFVTEEVLSKGSRVGFDVVTVPDGRRGVLSRKGGPRHQPRTGAYSVDVRSFEALALPTLQDDGRGDDEHVAYVLDEIGRMELHSEAFAATVEKLLARGVRLLGAITAPIYGHRVPFCDRVSASRGVAVQRLTAKIREPIVQQLCVSLLHRWRVAAPSSIQRAPPTDEQLPTDERLAKKRRKSANSMGRAGHASSKR